MPVPAVFTRGLPAQYWWLWSGTLINAVGGFVVPFLSIYLTAHLGQSVVFTSVAVACYGAGNALSCGVGGVLADRFGRRPTLLGAQLLAAVAMVGLGVATSQVMILFWSFLVGAGLNATRPARAAMMADLVPDELRLRAFSLNFWAINIGFAVAPVLAGALVDGGYLWLFLGNAAANLLYGVIVFFKVPETKPEHDDTARQAPGSAVFADRAFLLFLFVTLAMAIVFQQYTIALPLDMAAHGVPPAQYGLVIGVNGAMIALLQIPASRLLERFRPYAVLGFAALLTGLGFGLTGFVDSAPLYAITVAIWTLGEIANSPTSMAVVASLSPAHMRGRYQGWYSLVWGIATAVAPLLSGLAIASGGTSLVWLACAAIGVCCAAVQLKVDRNPVRNSSWGVEHARQPATAVVRRDPAKSA